MSQYVTMTSDYMAELSLYGFIVIQIQVYQMVLRNQDLFGYPPDTGGNIFISLPS